MRVGRFIEQCTDIGRPWCHLAEAEIDMQQHQFLHRRQGIIRQAIHFMRHVDALVIDREDLGDDFHFLIEEHFLDVQIM